MPQKRILFISIVLHVSQFLFATTYYVKNDGNDTNSGIHPDSSWATISKINSFLFEPGDSILFNCGDTWRELLNVPSSGTFEKPIYFGTYGNGDRPRLFASDKAIGWIATGVANIWKSSTDLLDPYASPYEGGVFFEKDGIIIWGSEKKVYDAGFTNLTKEFDWTWYSNAVYIYAPTDPNGRYDNVDVSQRKFCIYLNNKEHLIFDSLDIRYSKIGNIKEAWPYSDKDGLIIKYCFSGYASTKGSTEGFGIECYHSNSYIHHNIITECGRRGMSIYTLDATSGNMHNIIIEYNTIYNCYHTGIDFAADNNATANNIYIRNNYIYETDTQEGAYGGMHHISIIGKDNEITMNNIYVYNNVSVNTTKGSLYINCAEGVKVYNNTFYGLNQNSTIFTGQVYIQGSTNHCEIINNIFYNNYSNPSHYLRACIYAGYGWSDLDIDYNLYYVEDSTRVYAWNLQGYGGGYLLNNWKSLKLVTKWDEHSPPPSNPEFISSSDLHLQSSSPAIGAGVNVGLITDFDENCYNNPPSIGAFEGNPIDCPDTPKSEEYFIYIYPNPTNNIVNIRLEGFNTTDPFILRIFNVTGKVYYSEEFLGKNEFQIPINLIPGTYIVQVFQKPRSLAGQKFFVIK